MVLTSRVKSAWVLHWVDAKSNCRCKTHSSGARTSTIHQPFKQTLHIVIWPRIETRTSWKLSHAYQADCNHNRKALHPPTKCS